MSVSRQRPPLVRSLLTARSSGRSRRPAAPQSWAAATTPVVGEIWALTLPHKWQSKRTIRTTTQQTIMITTMVVIFGSLVGHATGNPDPRVNRRRAPSGYRSDVLAVLLGGDRRERDFFARSGSADAIFRTRYRPAVGGRAEGLGRPRLATARPVSFSQIAIRQSTTFRSIESTAGTTGLATGAIIIPGSVLERASRSGRQSRLCRQLLMRSPLPAIGIITTMASITRRKAGNMRSCLRRRGRSSPRRHPPAQT